MKKLDFYITRKVSLSRLLILQNKFHLITTLFRFFDDKRQFYFHKATDSNNNKQKKLPQKKNEAPFYDHEAGGCLVDSESKRRTLKIVLPLGKTHGVGSEDLQGGFVRLQQLAHHL